MSSTNGPDTIYLTKGKNLSYNLNGKGGKDTLVLYGKRSDWGIQFNYERGKKPSFLLTLNHTRAQSVSQIKSGYSWLDVSNFEVLKFEDKTYDLTKKIKIYQNKNPAPDGASRSLASNINSRYWYGLGFQDIGLTFITNSTIRLSKHNDNIFINKAGEAGAPAFVKSSIYTGGGDDVFTVNSYHLGVSESKIFTGSGNDKVNVTINKQSPDGSKTSTFYYTYAASSIDLGQGHDEINDGFSYKSSFDGGTGYDSVTFTGNKSDYVFKTEGEYGDKDFKVEIVYKKQWITNYGQVLSSYTDSQFLNLGKSTYYNFERFIFKDETIYYGKKTRLGRKSLKASQEFPDILILGASRSNGTGNNSANKITGNRNRNSLYGKGGNDTIIGEGGNDKLYGGNGNDKLYGGNGNDLLFGGTGKDRLTGGKGKDIFRISRGAGYDIINDFSDGEDRIHFTSGTSRLKIVSKAGDALIYDGDDLLAKVMEAAGVIQKDGQYLI